MVWKPKEKELTREEAVALAKKELAPLWHHSPPLLAGVRGEKGPQALPLDPAFSEKPWLLFFVDPSDFSSEEALQYADEYNARYSALGVRTLILLQPHYPPFADPKGIEEYIRTHGIEFPLALDAERLLALAFRAESHPAVLLLSSNQVLLSGAGQNWMQDFERRLQGFLRSTDPGLPLPEPLDDRKPGLNDKLRIDLGRNRGAVFPTPAFPTTGPQGFSAHSFTGKENPAGPVRMQLQGLWIQDGDRIATQDPTAAIRLRSPSSSLGIIAQSLAKTQEDAIITFEVNDKPAFDIFGGRDLTFDDEGRAVVRVGSTRLHHALRELPERERDITLGFPSADRVSIALYGFRFAD